MTIAPSPDSYTPQPVARDNALVPTQSRELVNLFSSGQTLIVQGQGLILLRKGRYVDVVGAKAMIGGAADYTCQDVLVLGQVHFSHSDDHSERQQAFHRRLDWIQLLLHITGEEAPIRRAQTCLMQLLREVSARQLEQASDEWLSQICGVLPETMSLARRTVGLPALGHNNKPLPIPPCPLAPRPMSA